MKFRSVRSASSASAIQHRHGLRVSELDQALAQQKGTTASLKARNEAMDAEVRDLKVGLDAVEEHARLELGMIKRDEVFYQVVKK